MGRLKPFSPGTKRTGGKKRSKTPGNPDEKKSDCERLKKNPRQTGGITANRGTQHGSNEGSAPVEQRNQSPRGRKEYIHHVMGSVHSRKKYLRTEAKEEQAARGFFRNDWGIRKCKPTNSGKGTKARGKRKNPKPEEQLRRRTSKAAPGKGESKIPKNLEEIEKQRKRHNAPQV